MRSAGKHRGSLELCRSQVTPTVLYWMNYAFTMIFLLEMVMKMIGGGVVEYVKNAWNVMDSGIVSAERILDHRH